MIKEKKTVVLQIQKYQYLYDKCNFLELKFFSSLDYFIDLVEIFSPKYAVSKRGKSMLLDGNNNRYSMVSTNGYRSQFRCAFLINSRFVCKARASTYKDKNGNEFATFRGTHNHQ